MNDTTIKLVNDLAIKLGTTAEHLWGVLLKQAPISATAAFVTDVGVTGLCVYFALRIAKKIQQLAAANDADHEGKIITLNVVAICLGLIAVLNTVCFCSDMPLIIAGFFNPEYWAFKQIVK